MATEPVTPEKIIEQARAKYKNAGAVRICVLTRPESDETEWTLTAWSIPTVPTYLVHHIAVIEAPTLAALSEKIGDAR